MTVMSDSSFQIPPTMYALTLVQPGSPPEFALTRRSTPKPGPGEVLLRVDACGFCHHDLLVMSGVLRRGVTAGVTLGHEIAGTLVAIGPDAYGFHPGDRVVSLLTAACGNCQRCLAGNQHRCLHGHGIGHGRDGGFAQYVALPAAALVHVPDNIPSAQAALLACPSGVAMSAISAAKIAPTDTVVITGAGGGLGSHAVQLAAAQAAQVFAVTTSPDKTVDLESLGATVVIDAADGPDFSEIVMALTDDAGANAVIDTVGPPLWPATLRSLGQFGRLALLGDVSGETVPLRLAEVIFRDAQILGVSGVSLSTLQQTVDLAATGQLKPVVSRTLPLTTEGVLETIRLVSERQPLGRVVLTPPPLADPA